MAYNDHVIGPHCPIGVRRTMTVDGVEPHQVVEVNPGRIIFNQNIPQDLGFVDRTDPAHVCDYEVTFTCGKKQLGQIVDRTINKHGFHRCRRGAGRHQGHRLQALHPGGHHGLHRGYDGAPPRSTSWLLSPSRRFWTSRTSTRWAS